MASNEINPGFGNVTFHTMEVPPGGLTPDSIRDMIGRLIGGIQPADEAKCCEKDHPAEPVNTVAEAPEPLPEPWEAGLDNVLEEAFQEVSDTVQETGNFPVASCVFTVMSDGSLVIVKGGQGGNSEASLICAQACRRVHDVLVTEATREKIAEVREDVLSFDEALSRA